MPTPVDSETVNQVARLAKIQLSEQELQHSAEQLVQILNYVGHLEKVELPNDVEPFFGAFETENAIRIDQINSSVGRETIMKNAPKSDGEFYVVPPVFK